MPWTEEDLRRIDEAIAAGVLTVKHGEKVITYRSMSELLAVRERILRAMNAVRAKRRSYLSLGTGYEK